MATIQIKSWKTDETIFEYDGTIEEAVEEAVRQGISLEWASLRGANLYRANLNVANLEWANLEWADLSFADLSGAKLSEADLSGANLNGADLECAYLYNANLEGADLINADLEGADLSFADLKNVNLEGANLSHVNLRHADLIGADLRDAYLYGADLREANLEGAKFFNADLSGTIGIPDDIIPSACPAKGSFVAWKKVNGKLVKLEIPEEAKRSSATTKKCRCSKAKVLAITNLGETETFDKVLNVNYVPYITYKVGEMVYPDSFDEDRWVECSHGIHFFMDKNDALNW